MSRRSFPDWSLLGADAADCAGRLGHATQTMGVVSGLQMFRHRRADLGRTAWIGPNRVIDVEAAAALLAKPGDAAGGVFGASIPYAETAKPSRIGHRRRQ